MVLSRGWSNPKSDFISGADQRLLLSLPAAGMQPVEEMGWLPQLVVLKDGQVIDNLLLHGKETFVVGRHQNCDVVAGHASISRHHLEIRVLHGSRELLLTDLHSVHGTRINEKLVLPMDPITMNEDDKFQLGASTRTYLVKWIPVTQEFSDSSSSSFTPSKSTGSSLIGGLEEEFQSVLKLSDKENCENWSPGTTKPTIQQQQQHARIAFSDVNGRSPRTNLPQKLNVKAALSPARKTSPSPNTSQISAAALRMSPAGKKIFGDVSCAADQTPSKLWLRRCISNPLPSIVTNAEVPSAPKLVSYEDSPADDLTKTNAVEEESYPSDKENVAPQMLKAPPSQKARQPFKQLFFLPSPTAQKEYQPVFEPAPLSTSSDEDSLDVPKHCRQYSTQTLDADAIFSRRLTSDSKQWHVVVDTNCFLDEESFKALKQLEGIRETRIIIPKIVIRELDFMKRSENLKYRARQALKWIEECMVRLASWIHVQSSNETRPVGGTPPVSPGPEVFPFGNAMDLLSPTNDDHVLDCAILFSRSISEGSVVLLTNDTALKIKAMAEGLVSEGSITFCESLLDPYSERFLWAGSRPTSTWSAPLISPLSRSNLSGSCGGSSSGKQRLQEKNLRGLQVVL